MHLLKQSISVNFVLDINIPQEGIVEISDFDTLQDRNRIYRFYRLSINTMWASGIGCLVSIIFVLQNSFWYLFLLVAILSIGILSYRNSQALSYQLPPAISTIVIYLSSKNEMEHIFVREWINTQLESYSEKEVRSNQMVGFKAILMSDGLIKVELLVDLQFPGTKIFETYDFYSLAELIKLFDELIPDSHQWYYQDENGASWDSESKETLNQEIEMARIPWRIRESLNLST